MNWTLDDVQDLPMPIYDLIVDELNAAAAARGR